MSPLRPDSPSNLKCVQSSGAVKYVVSAEFDNKIGSVIKHQVPRKIPGFKENLQELGDLMIPLNFEQKTSEDYTVFLLYKDSSNKYRTFPDSDRDIYGSSGIERLNIHEIGTIYESQTSSANKEDDSQNEDDDVLFFLNVTKTIKSDTDERGAKIRSIGIGTPIRNFIIFKHFITIAIQLYIVDGSILHLITLFNAINGIDISLWQRYISLNSQLHNNLSLSYQFNNRLILSSFKCISPKAIPTQSVNFKNGMLQYHSSIGSTDPLSSQLSRIPINFPLALSINAIPTDLNLNSKILTFFKHLASKLNQIKYKNFNVLIYSDNKVAQTDVLCQFILFLSNYLNGFDNPYFSNDKILYFPLIDLANWDNLIEFDKHSKTTKFIGANNPILKNYDDFYDFWYDLDKEVMETSSKLEIYDNKMIINKTFDFQELLTELISKKHDSNTVILSLKRFNIWQILKILKRDVAAGADADSVELNMKDYYLSENKNLILFGDFFEYKTIDLIEKIGQFLAITSVNHISFHEIEQLLSIYRYFTQFVSISNQNIGKFLFILELYPTRDIKHPATDLLVDVEDIQLNITQNSLINLIFKFILLENQELQKCIYKLFKIFNDSTFKLILDERFNSFTRLLIDEYTSKTKSNSEKKTNGIKRSKATLLNKVKESK